MVQPQSDRFGPAVQCAAVAVSPAWSPLMATSIVAVAAVRQGRARGSHSCQRAASGASRRGPEPDTCEVILAAILVAPTLAPCRWLHAPRGMSVRQSDSWPPTTRRPCLSSGLGVASETGSCIRPSCVWTKSIFFSAALDLGSVLRAAKTRVTYGGTWPFQCPLSVSDAHCLEMRRHRATPK
jgi:hypothetical protein